MALDYVTVWNGVHGDQDGDLLDASLRLPRKVRVVPEPRRRETLLDLVANVLSTTPEAALTLQDLHDRTGIKKPTICHALNRLREQGRLRSVAIAPGRFFRTRPQQKYWLDLSV